MADITDMTLEEALDRSKWRPGVSWHSQMDARWEVMAAEIERLQNIIHTHDGYQTELSKKSQESGRLLNQRNALVTLLTEVGYGNSAQIVLQRSGL